ncbi:hypothetical protein M5X00_14695 [Paenibacillus alvei]|uniref:hypothetical protein n=1 Tax=Paenibacillus alvei TaxID=44250 RepID=UPI000289D1F4|nr:hypothetical protein [Paenibacillus alvei]EJW20023.1 hypothetical protein PAV_1c10180 [Paenibacillus alvei DSM 29]MCY9543390.1 hypothetical protein [Paenibacillus alvei]MCY9704730.1 hypothetical protein [Paenibacillus alvei]MCY9733717.1 hypothetical protein [Paenibacillus alvei]MCY9755492.1 hypothetical protein [Paenibacillus alvei]
MAKKQATETIQGVEYTFQHPGVRESVRLRDRSKNKAGQLVEEKYYNELMTHVIVQPKVSWDYFDEHPEAFDDVMLAAVEFLNPPSDK